VPQALACCMALGGVRPPARRKSEVSPATATVKVFFALDTTAVMVGALEDEQTSEELPSEGLTRSEVDTLFPQEEATLRHQVFKGGIAVYL
jgi:hypothetical protein